MLVPGVASLVGGEPSQSLELGVLESAWRSACTAHYSFVFVFTAQKPLIYLIVCRYSCIVTRCKEQLNYARNMHLGGHLSVQETCCMDIGFRHMSSASGCASSGVRHAPFGQRKGNHEIMCIYFVRLCIVLLTRDRRFVPGRTGTVGPCSNQAGS